MNCLIIIGFNYLIISEGRLVERTTKKETTFPDSQISGLKVRRETYGEQELTGLYLEDDSEMFKNINKYGHSYDPFIKSSVRMLRDSKETRDKERNNSTGISKKEGTDDARKNMVVLVKKPIRNFKSIDYDGDYQMRPNKVLIFVDSIEHEDEDFNIDDYDFDVNHDEFSGRGKHLEPRAKINNYKDKNEKIDMALKSYGKPKVLPPLIKTKVMLSGKNHFSIAESRDRIKKRCKDLKSKDNEYDENSEDDDETVDYDAKTTTRAALSVHNVSLK